MDMPVKDSPGLCRCCFSEGCYKDLSTAYAWMGDTEIYADMLLECFDISITQHVDGPNGPNRLICEVCITRLRDASNFKKQVLNCEKKFIDMVAKGAFKASTSEFNVQVSVEKEPKLEPILEEDIETPNLDYLDVLDYDDDFDPKGEASTSHQSDDNEPLAKLTTRKRKLKPKKETATKAAKGKAPKVVKKEEKPKATKKGSQDAKESIQSSNNKQTARLALLALLQKSTAVAFRCAKEDFMCFFCDKTFVRVSDLHCHSARDHPIYIVTWDPHSGQRVNIDISNLQCKLCSKKVPSLEDFFEHLTLHSFQYNKSEILSYLRSFNLLNDTHFCEECGEVFKSAPLLVSHRDEYHPIKVKIEIETEEVVNEERVINKDDIVNAADFAKKGKFNDTNITKINISSETRSSLINNAKLDENKPRKKKKPIPYVTIFRKNFKLLLQNTNVVPFRRSVGTQYQCYHCPKMHTLVADLRDCCKDFDSEKLKIQYWPTILKIDITDLHCKVCFARADDVTTLIKHLHLNHSININDIILNHLEFFKLTDDTMDCLHCGKQFTYFGALKHHITLEHNRRKNYVCEVCGKSFVGEKIRFHLISAHGHEKVKCRFCVRLFDTKAEKEHHETEAHNVTCEVCLLTFPTPNRLKTHMEKVHDIWKVVYKCDHCSKKFSSLCRMDKHVRCVHLLEKNLECTVCGAKFFEQGTLKQHMVKHSDARPVQCEICKNTFTHKNYLRSHMRSHKKQGHI